MTKPSAPDRRRVLKVAAAGLGAGLGGLASTGSVAGEGESGRDDSRPAESIPDSAIDPEKNPYRAQEGPERPPEPPGYSWIQFDDYRWRVLMPARWFIILPNSLFTPSDTPRDRFHAVNMMGATDQHLVVQASQTGLSLDGAFQEHIATLQSRDPYFSTEWEWFNSQYTTLSTGQTAIQYLANRTSPYRANSMAVTTIAVEGGRMYEMMIAMEYTITFPQSGDFETQHFLTETAPTVGDSFGVW